MTGKKLLDTILVGVMLLSTLAVVGLFFYTEKIYKKPPIDENAEKEKLLNERAQELIPTFFHIEKMIISLTPHSESKNNHRLRWLELELSFSLFDPKDLGFFKEYLPLLQDQIIEVSSKMPPEELNTLSGKLILSDRLKKAINKSLGKVAVKNVHFSKFVLQ